MVQRPRLAWLDALRGVAALTVALHHASYDYLPGVRQAVLGWFDAGTYGVMVFFLVSGYIVPVSLERDGSVRRFWISRVFRIYPLWTVACGVTLGLMTVGLYRSRGGPNGLTATIAHATMLQDLLAVPNVLNVLWTLSYEMAFYLLVVAFFAVRIHRRSTTIALVFSMASLTLGGALPTAALSGSPYNDMIVLLVALLGVGAIALASRRSVTGAVLGGALAIVLVAVNGRVSPAEGLAILAVMFTGTAIHRAEKGQTDHRVATSAIGVVLFATLLTGVWNIYREDISLQRGWCTAIVAAAMTFCLAMALRHRRIPGWLSGLGRISYSLYLLHPVLLAVFRVAFGGGPDRPEHGSVLLLIAFVPVLVALSWMAQRFVEAPVQRLGRRLSGRAEGTGDALAGAALVRGEQA
ncbi:acyltransferase [Actinoallomurus sp. NPDC052308]|uniref:acyltransferase family protein n=1 Tax=Actinoallomurus sp. NPDC052308 TaxID=3155530 RepID=UPI0034159188